MDPDAAAVAVEEVGHGLKPGSREWLEARRSGIGGSDVAAVVDLSPWRSAFEVFLDKRGELAEPMPDSEPMRWGRILEPVLREQYELQTGRTVKADVPMLRCVAHPHMLANLDGIEPSYKRVIEFKTARSGNGWGEDGSDQVPLAYMLQVQHYMYITGFEMADVAVLIGGCDFRIMHIDADRDLQDMLVEAEHVFWQRVQNNDPPPCRDIKDARLRWGHLAARGTVLADAADLSAVEQLHETQELLKDLKASESEQKAILMQRLGEAGDMLVDPATGNALVTWKLGNGPRGFAMDDFQMEHPDLYQRYIRPGKPVRRFLLK